MHASPGALPPSRRSAVSAVVTMSTSGSYRESLARHCPNEALHLGLVVVVVHAGADERVDSAGGQINPRQAGLMGIDVHRAQPFAPLAAAFAPLDKGHDPALLHSTVVHAHPG